MKKAVKNFENGEFVFAKVKGYCPWPAKIVTGIKKTYNVYFYGTGQTGTIYPKDIFKYGESKEKFANAKTMKRAKFLKAIEEIEAAMDQKDLVPIHLTESAEVVTVVEVKQEPPADTSEEVTANKNPERRVRRKVTTKTEPLSELGRKVKVKTERHSVAESKKVSRVQKRRATTNKKVGKGSKPIAKVTPFNIVNDLLMVYLPIGKCIGIKVYHNKPEFSNEEQEKKWMEQARKDAAALKLKLAIGQVQIDSIMDRIIVEPENGEISEQENKRFKHELFDMENALFIERDFFGLCQQVHDSVSLRRANVGLCLELLEEIKTVELNKLMLLRNPICVDAIRRLRRYNGNLDIWKMKRTDEKEFKVLAEKIRYRANEIYESFVNLFGDDDISAEPNFWKGFCKRVEIYKNNTRNLNENVRITMTEATYDKLVEAKIEEAEILKAAEIDTTTMDDNDEAI